MGQRANLAIVTAAPGYELYYSHWRAHTLDADLFWGPEAALPFARAQRSEAQGASWLDEVFAEGGAVIDTVRCELLWFGGEDVLYDVPLRRVHLALMRAMWPGWTVRWADEGIADLVRALALPITTVLVAERVTHDLPVLTPPAEADWISGAISVRRASGARELHGLDALFGELARLGARLLDALGPATSAPSLDLRASSTRRTGGSRSGSRRPRRTSSAGSGRRGPGGRSRGTAIASRRSSSAARGGSCSPSAVRASSPITCVAS